MRAPSLRGRIDRRICVFHRLDPAVARGLLPAPLRPRLFRGWAVGGICVLRLARLRPKLLPIPIGLGSELAWHRLAVEWEENGRTLVGQYLLRSETDARLAPLPGSKLVPPPIDRTRIEVRSEEAGLVARVVSAGGLADVDLVARPTQSWTNSQLFKSATAAHAALASGHVIWTSPEDGGLEGVELHSTGGKLEALELLRLESAWFDDSTRFQAGTVALDCAVLVRDADHEWATPIQAERGARVPQAQTAPAT